MVSAMARRSKIRVNVEPGTFSTERAVSFEAGGRRYNLLVDAEDVQDNTLTVYVVAERDDLAVIDLPRETFTSGSRVTIPKGALVTA
jgi:hypothetical protein